VIPVLVEVLNEDGLILVIDDRRAIGPVVEHTTAMCGLVRKLVVDVAAWFE